MQKIVTPETWYIAFWILMGVSFLTGLYFTVKWAVIAAVLHVRDIPY
jgi:hypothetical protein